MEDLMGISSTYGKKASRYKLEGYQAQIDQRDSLLQQQRGAESQKSMMQLQGYAYGAQALAQVGKASIDYSTMKIENMFAENNASAIEMQAEQRANQYLDEFNQAVGNATYTATRRGIVAEGGSLQRNLEESAKNLGEDTSMMRKSAKMKAGRIRSQAKINQIMGRAKMVSGIVGGIGSAATAGYMIGGAK